MTKVGAVLRVAASRVRADQYAGPGRLLACPRRRASPSMTAAAGSAAGRRRRRPSTRRTARRWSGVDEDLHDGKRLTDVLELQALRRRHRRPDRLTPDSDPTGVTAELRSVGLHPTNGRQHVVVGSREHCLRGAAALRRHDDGPSLVAQSTARGVVGVVGVDGEQHETAAVDPRQDRQAPRPA